MDQDEGGAGPDVVPFTKLHGNGNDFILIDEILFERVFEEEKAPFAARYCHRNFGIGGDGVLFLSGSVSADIRMRLFQPDGSEAEMCGNGIRCLAKYAWDAGYVGDSFDVETPAGIIPVQVREVDGTFWALVDMGEPRYNRAMIPALGEGDLMKEVVEGMEVSAVNTGVPHAVVMVDDLEISIGDIAPSIRNSAIFPEGANVNFVKVGSTLKMRTFERGVEGETLSCGTGAVASAAVARRMGLIGDEVVIETRGGPLKVHFLEGTAYMEGPAVTVFAGELSRGFRNLSQEL